MTTFAIGDKVRRVLKHGYADDWFMAQTGSKAGDIFTVRWAERHSDGTVRLYLDHANGSQNFGLWDGIRFELATPSYKPIPTGCTTAHGVFEPGDVVRWVGPAGDQDKTAIIKTVGPCFSVVFPSVDLESRCLRSSEDFRHFSGVADARPDVPEWQEMRPVPARADSRHYIVAVMLAGEPVPSSFPVTHDSRALAEHEARRLSEKHPGRTFGVYGLLSQTIYGDTERTRRFPL